MRDGIRLLYILLLSGLCSAQARPFPGGDVQQIYQRLLPQIEKIAAFDHHAHPGYADDPDVDAMAAPPNASEAHRHSMGSHRAKITKATAVIPWPLDRPSFQLPG